MEHPSSNNDDFAFHRCHKLHRKRKDLDDWSHLLDFHNPTHIQGNSMVEQVSCSSIPVPFFSLPTIPGFYFFPNALSEPLQRLLEIQALHVYCKAPFRTSLDLSTPRSSSDALGGTTHPYPSNKLSWATLGYHYNWTDRSYSPSDRSVMPKELETIARHFATAAMRKNMNTTHDDPSYTATAGIVNYYTTKSSMGGHRDDVEQAVNKPVVSLSLGGRPAVFCVGGAHLDAEPVIPMVVRPGDVVVLSGECRLYYHSMARLLPRDLPVPQRKNLGFLSVEDVFDESVTSSQQFSQEDYAAVSTFLLDKRINVNLRQVYENDS